MYGTVKAKEVINLLDIELGTDWKLGTALEVIADIEAAASITMTGPFTATNLSANANAPGTNAASIALIGQKDSSVGSKATLDVETEEVVAAIGTFTPSHKLAVWINAVEYNLQLDAV